jgi:hypothetical protein
MATLPTSPISKASFTANTYTFDPLPAAETISQSALIGGAAALTHGTVLFGPAIGTPITGTTVLTPVFATGLVARCILAADIDVTAGNLTGLVYTQGKFLDTAMTFTSQGAALDVAQLWDTGIYVLTVEQRSGLLVPMTGLPATGGPLPQVAPKESLRDELRRLEAQVEKDRQQIEQLQAEEKKLEAESATEAKKEHDKSKDQAKPNPAVPNPKH